MRAPYRRGFTKETLQSPFIEEVLLLGLCKPPLWKGLHEVPRGFIISGNNMLPEPFSGFEHVCRSQMRKVSRDDNREKLRAVNSAHQDAQDRDGNKAVKCSKIKDFQFPQQKISNNFKVKKVVKRQKCVNTK